MHGTQLSGFGWALAHDEGGSEQLWRCRFARVLLHDCLHDAAPLRAGDAARRVIRRVEQVRSLVARRRILQVGQISRQRLIQKLGHARDARPICAGWRGMSVVIWSRSGYDGRLRWRAQKLAVLCERAEVRSSVNPSPERLMLMPSLSRRVTPLCSREVPKARQVIGQGGNCCWQAYHTIRGSACMQSKNEPVFESLRLGLGWRGRQRLVLCLGRHPCLLELWVINPVCVAAAIQRFMLRLRLTLGPGRDIDGLIRGSSELVTGVARTAGGSARRRASPSVA